MARHPHDVLHLPVLGHRVPYAHFALLAERHQLIADEEELVDVGGEGEDAQLAAGVGTVATDGRLLVVQAPEVDGVVGQ